MANPCHTIVSVIIGHNLAGFSLRTELRYENVCIVHYMSYILRVRLCKSIEQNNSLISINAYITVLIKPFIPALKN
jgi:hypothetical protein